MNILLINHYAGSPEYGMEYRPYYLSREWVRSGHNVMVVAASESHLRQQTPLMEGQVNHENIDGINYCWVKANRYSGNGISRVLNMLLFSWKLFFLRKKILSGFKPDVVIASSPQPFILSGSRKIARQYQAQLFFEVRDLWPLSLIELVGVNASHPFIRLMQLYEDRAYRYANRVVSLLPAAKEYMQQRGMDEHKFVYIPNGVDISTGPTADDVETYVFKEVEELREKYKYLVGFAGTHGPANALQYLVEAAELLKDENIGVVLLGQGIEKPKLMTLAKEKNLDNVIFLDPVKKQFVSSFHAAMDALYIGLQRHSLFRFGVSPNKLFEYMLSAKPIIYAVESGNDPVSDANCGISCQAENAESVASAIRKLRQMDAKELGKNGYNYVIKNHNYACLAKSYIKAIEESNKTI
jgi:glycosyltransferase involved in cell wall biosynthesis